MSQIILDISANTHKNNWVYLRRMLTELKEIDTGKHEIIIKHQLFMHEGENIPLSHATFEHAYNYALTLGYKTTASVFDIPSLEFLLQFDIPFVKIANRRDLDWLIGEVPRKVPVYVSIDGNSCTSSPIISRGQYLYCISKYPASNLDYENYPFNPLTSGISDHTTDLELFNQWEPKFYECHYKLEDSTGLDAGEFARTPAQLKEIL